MKLTRKQIRELQRDYFLARSGEGDELVMEPFCWCGAALEPEYECAACNHKCRVTLVLCTDPGALAIAKRLVETSADFRQFEVAALGE